MGNEEEPKGIPIYFDDNEPEIQLPSMDSEPHKWHAANIVAFKALRCFEAVLDIERLLKILASENDPSTDRHVVKLLATPIYNFGVTVRDLFNELQGNANEYQGRLSGDDRRAIKKEKRKFESSTNLSNGPLRKVRDKLSSHIDKGVFLPESSELWKYIDLREFLRTLRNILDTFIFLLSLDVYSWTRESVDQSIMRLMALDSKEVHLNIEEKVIVALTIAVSPKYFMSDKVVAMAETWVELMNVLDNKDI